MKSTHAKVSELPAKRRTYGTSTAAITPAMSGSRKHTGLRAYPL